MAVVLKSESHEAIFVATCNAILKKVMLTCSNSNIVVTKPRMNVL